MGIPSTCTGGDALDSACLVGWPGRPGRGAGVLGQFLQGQPTQGNPEKPESNPKPVAACLAGWPGRPGRGANCGGRVLHPGGGGGRSAAACWLTHTGTRQQKSLTKTLN